MAKLSHGTDFTGTPPFSGAQLNNLVDAATVLPGIVTDWGAAIPVGGDSFMFYSAGGGALSKCTLNDIIGAFPGDASAGTKSLRTLGTGALQAVAGNDTRIPASVTGIRKSAGAGSTDVAALPNDLKFTPVNINALTNIDWSAADVFYDTALSGNKTYTFSNVGAGRIIVLQINQNGHTVTFPGGWLVLGSVNTASWNVYCMINSAGASLITVAN